MAWSVRSAHCEAWSGDIPVPIACFVRFSIRTGLGLGGGASALLGAAALPLAGVPAVRVSQADGGYLRILGGRRPPLVAAPVLAGALPAASPVAGALPSAAAVLAGPAVLVPV